VNRPAVIVLLLTFVALLGVLCYVPIQYSPVVKTIGMPPPSRTWLWDHLAAGTSGPEEPIAKEDEPQDSGPSSTVEDYFQEMVAHAQGHAVVGPVVIRRGRWALDFALTLAIGGLLGLALHTRQRKRLAIGHE